MRHFYSILVSLCSAVLCSSPVIRDMYCYLLEAFKIYAVGSYSCWWWLGGKSLLKSNQRLEQLLYQVTIHSYLNADSAHRGGVSMTSYNFRHIVLL